LGVGPRPIPLANLSVDGLARALRTAVGDETMRQRAAALGERIRDEDGIGQAVEVFQRSLATVGQPIRGAARQPPWSGQRGLLLGCHGSAKMEKATTE
jgi:hypothetical protein